MIVLLLLAAIAAALTFDIPLRIQVEMVDRRCAHGDISLDKALELIGRKVGTRRLLEMLNSNKVEYLNDAVITGALASNMVHSDAGWAARDGLIGYMCGYGLNEWKALYCAEELCRYNDAPGVRDKLLESVVQLKRPLVTPYLIESVGAKVGKASIPYLIASLYANPEYAFAAESSLMNCTGEKDIWGFRDWNSWWALHKQQGMPSPGEIIKKVTNVSVSAALLRGIPG